MAETPTPSVGQFFTTSDFLTHTATSNSESPSQTINPYNLDVFFEIEATIEWIRCGNFKRVALQFPDSFLMYSGYVSKRISEAISDVKTFILADTSYRSCCVDFVAAAHTRCDCLVHYGDACLLSPSTEIPARFVLGQLPCDIEACCSSVAENIGSIEIPVVILTDAPYNYVIDKITSNLHDKCPSISFFDAKVVLNNTDYCKEGLVLGRNVPPELKDATDIALVFVGSSSSPFLPIWLMTFPQISTIISYDPTTGNGCTERSFSMRQLRKRLFLVEKLKDANTVAFVVGTVGLEGHKEAISRMRTLCKSAGKKIYVISVGKVNVPKLANFSSDIDVFVLISCPFGILLDTTDFFKPVLSLFEAEVALNPHNSWAAATGWTADFAKFLHDPIGEMNDDGDVSLVTGKIRARIDLSEEGEGNNAHQVALYSAGDYFKQRSWKGLDDSVRTSEATEISEGRAGIAASYATEPNS